MIQSHVTLELQSAISAITIYYMHHLIMYLIMTAHAYVRLIFHLES
jgi:hypothetical protein